MVPEGSSKTTTDLSCDCSGASELRSNAKVLGPITDKKITTCFLSLITLMAKEGSQILSSAGSNFLICPYVAMNLNSLPNIVSKGLGLKRSPII